LRHFGGSRAPHGRPRTVFPPSASASTYFLQDVA
jgi:hypothetical protein